MKRKGSVTQDTVVTKLGLNCYITDDGAETEDARASAAETLEKKDVKKTKREKKNGRFYKFVKRHFIQRKNSSNDVKEIHIVPEGDELKWARRSAGSAVSRSSEETTTSEDDRLEVVHDMDEEDIVHV